MNPAIITRLDLTLAAPEIFILSAACIILLIDLFLDEQTRWESFVLSLFALAGAAWVTTKTGVDVRTVAWHGTLTRGLSWDTDGVRAAVDQAMEELRTEYDVG